MKQWIIDSLHRTNLYVMRRSYETLRQNYAQITLGLVFVSHYCTFLHCILGFSKLLRHKFNSHRSSTAPFALFSFVQFLALKNWIENIVLTRISENFRKLLLTTFKVRNNFSKSTFKVHSKLILLGIEQTRRGVISHLCFFHLKSLAIVLPTKISYMMD